MTLLNSINLSSLSTMPVTSQGTLLAIEALDLSAIRNRFQTKFKLQTSKAIQIELEYRKFLYLVSVSKGDEIGMGGLVDDFWHEHILDTIHYAKMCDEIFGFFLHHVPTAIDVEQTSNKLTISVTIDRLAKLFSSVNSEYWGSVDGLATCGNSCASCGGAKSPLN
jgi:hypothetical protein